MIRLGKVSDIPSVMEFINEYWRKGHILSRDRELFEYEYRDGDNLNMVLSIDEEGRVEGFEGFVPYGKTNRDVTLSMWKSNSKTNPMLGIEIFNYLRENSDACRISCPGINKKTFGIYQYLGFQTGTMKQWYRLAVREEYSIAVVNNTDIPQYYVEQKKWVKLTDFAMLKSYFDFEWYYLSGIKPIKEEWYMERRYFNHPIYDYHVYGILDKKERCETLLVFRVQEYNGKKVLRLVDVVGRYDELYNVTEEIDKLLVEYDAEYVDMYEYGMDVQKMTDAGWRRVKESGNIIPNYFGPFVQENIDIHYCVDDPKTVLFKGDGDQDRPN